MTRSHFVLNATLIIRTDIYNCNCYVVMTTTTEQTTAGVDTTTEQTTAPRTSTMGETTTVEATTTSLEPTTTLKTTTPCA